MARVFADIFPEEFSGGIKRIHFFGNDVAFAPNSTGEEFRGLKSGCANFAETKCAEDFVGGLLDVIPQDCVRRQQIARASNCLEFCFVGHFVWAKSYSSPEESGE